MEQKINILELLKNCPSGMELDCTMIENVYFDEVLTNSIKCFYIKNSTKTRSTIYFTKFGEYVSIDNAKCVIFPKGKTTWEGFHRPFKDGDVVVSSLGNIHILKNRNTSYIFVDFEYNSKGCLCKSLTTCVNAIRLATEEEKQKLFDAIKANGYRWNEETKTLEELPKFKDGDVIANNTRIVIFHKLDKVPNGVRNDVVYYHCWYHKESNNSKFKIDFGIGYASDFRFATEEEKEKLFKVIKENGYKWNPESKTLEKLVKPKFKVGDVIKTENQFHDYKIIKITDTHYTLGTIPNAFIYDVEICEDKNWKLIPNKFDISTLKPFESRVLVRTSNRKWVAAFYSHYDKDASLHYCVVGGLWYEQCIPYKGNEHLLNTTNDCDEFYKNW